MMHIRARRSQEKKYEDQGLLDVGVAPFLQYVFLVARVAPDS